MKHHRHDMFRHLSECLNEIEDWGKDAPESEQEDMLELIEKRLAELKEEWL